MPVTHQTELPLQAYMSKGKRDEEEVAPTVVVAKEIKFLSEERELAFWQSSWRTADEGLPYDVNAGERPNDEFWDRKSRRMRDARQDPLRTFCFYLYQRFPKHEMDRNIRKGQKYDPKK
eukprot:4140864-Amphidinium_carterae.5